MNYKITAIPVGLVEFVWQVAAPALKMATDLSCGEASLESTFERLLKGDAMLVLVTEGNQVVAAATFDIRTFESGLKCLYIPLIGGTGINEWGMDLFRLADRVAKDFGCHEIRGVSVRAGWMRKLSKLGWKECNVTISCPVGQVGDQ